MSKEFLSLTITAHHLMENLSSELYKSPADCLAEIWRNAACACMLGDKWEPKRAHVEINLVPNHPLTKVKRNLEVFDKGSGFVTESLSRFCFMGPSLDDVKRSKNGNLGGAQKKRIGRFAAFALNEEIMENRNPDTGFYILTRTATRGIVTLISMIPSEIERNSNRIAVQLIPDNSPMLGPRRNYVGSFTSIVIPHSVFSTHAEIEEAVMWKIPRKPELMFKMLVGGKEINPPKLADRINDAKNGMEIHVDILERDDDPNGGIWLTDATTGLRVAYAPDLSDSLLPYPFWHTRFVGDIFLPGLLEQQNTSRSSLVKKFANKKNAKWLSILGYLNNFCPQMKALLGDRDVFQPTDSFTSSLLDVVKEFNTVFGEPPDVGGPTIDLPDDILRRVKKNGGGKHEGGNGGNGGGGKPGGETGEPKPRTMPVQIDGQTFYLLKRELPDVILVQVNMSRPNQLLINGREYKCLPKGQGAKGQHIKDCFINAVAQYRHPDNSGDMIRVAGEIHKKFMGR